MFRRQFVQLITFAGAGGLAKMAATDEHGTVRATYRVKGFSCVTCAAGLDAMLQQKPGVRASRSLYPEGTLEVNFDPKLVTDAKLQAWITEMGFTIELVGTEQGSGLRRPGTKDQ